MTVQPVSIIYNWDPAEYQAQKVHLYTFLTYNSMMASKLGLKFHWAKLQKGTKVS